MKKLFQIIIILFVAILLLASCTEEEATHVHEYGVWRIESSETCTAEGLRKRSCLVCGHYETQVIPARGHSFGDWIQENEIVYHACNACGYREFQYNGNADQNQAGSGVNQPTLNQILAEYPNFDTFLADCKTSGANVISYNGSSNTFEVNFSDGVNTCDYYTVHIPSRVTDVKFSGSLNGTPFQNLKLVIDDRSTGINILFENILIESTETILESQTRNINVCVYMQGSKCSLEVAKANNGANGADKTSLRAEAGGGSNGQNGSPAMLINGNCKLICSAQNVIIRGGDGGNGGNGGSVGWGHFGKGGWGGKGGNGANAVSGETLATVEVIGNANVSIVGGSGGDGGYGGRGAGVEPDGNPGESGANGGSGCKNFIYKESI